MWDRWIEKCRREIVDDLWHGKRISRRSPPPLFGPYKGTCEIFTPRIESQDCTSPLLGKQQQRKVLRDAENNGHCPFLSVQNSSDREFGRVSKSRYWRILFYCFISPWLLLDRLNLIIAVWFSTCESFDSFYHFDSHHHDSQSHLSIEEEEDNGQKRFYSGGGYLTMPLTEWCVVQGFIYLRPCFCEFEMKILIWPIHSFDTPSQAILLRPLGCLQ